MIVRVVLRLLPCALLLAMLSPASATAPDGPLALREMFSRSFTGTPPAAPRWSPDSAHLAFRWSDGTTAHRELWVSDANGDALHQLPSPPAASNAGVREVLWLEDGTTLLTLRGEALWQQTLAGEPPVRLGATGAGAWGLDVSPDATVLSWLRDGDLWVLRLKDGTVHRLTDIGVPSIATNPAGRYARRDREIGPGIWSGPTYAWSPDGRYIAAHVVDRREMRTVPFPDYLAQDTAPNHVHRGYPGDANEARSVALIDVATGALRLLPLEDPTARQVIDFAWSPQGELLIDVASDTNVDRWLYVASPDTGALRQIWRSRRTSRIYTSFASAWHPDGEQVVFLSDLADRYGLYAVDTSGSGAPTLLTDPTFDVLSGPHVTAATGEIYFTGNGVSPYEQHVYRVTPDAGSAAGATRLTSRPGRHRGWPSPDGRYLAVLHDADTMPPELDLIDTQSGTTRRLTHSTPDTFDQQPWASAQYVTFPSQIDDYELHARILTPPDMDPNVRHPVIFGPVYSGTARNRWGGNYALVQQLLTRKGYIVVQVDVRGSTGYGRDFREEFLVDFAGEDIDDLASAVSHIKTLPYVDDKRFGIWGSSYGGTLTVYTLLTRPGLFCAGVAAAAAVDPYFFGTDDVAIVRRPDTHPEIFERAARRYAANLEDHLLLIHGLLDQVVPFKTTAVLAEELIRQGKRFDFAFAPGATHGWSREAHYAPYLFDKLIMHFDRHLGEGHSCGAPPANTP